MFSTTQNENVRTDTVTNSRPGIKLYKLSQYNDSLAKSHSRQEMSMKAIYEQIYKIIGEEYLIDAYKNKNPAA